MWLGADSSKEEKGRREEKLGKHKNLWTQESLRSIWRNLRVVSNPSFYLIPPDSDSQISPPREQSSRPLPLPRPDWIPRLLRSGFPQRPPTGRAGRGRSHPVHRTHHF